MSRRQRHFWCIDGLGSRVRRLPFIVVLLLAATALVPASAPAAARIPKDWIGVMADGPLTTQPVAPDREWDRMKSSHVGFVRVTFYWAELQPQPTQLDLSST